MPAGLTAKIKWFSRNLQQFVSPSRLLLISLLFSYDSPNLLFFNAFPDFFGFFGNFLKPICELSSLKNNHNKDDEVFLELLIKILVHNLNFIECLSLDYY